MKIRHFFFKCNSENRASASKFRRIMSSFRHGISSINQISPARAKLLKSPGWNEGKARNEPLGTHERKVISSSVGAALTVRVLALRCGCVAPTGLINVYQCLTQGLCPGLCRSIAPLGLFYDNSKK